MIEKNFSDRFLAKVSNTLPESGNTPKAVSNSVRKFGLVDEEVWPHEGVKTIEEFYKDIPQEILDKGQKFLEKYEYGYEYADQSQLKEALRRSPVGVAVSAWQQNEAGEYIHFGRYNHWVVLVAFDEQDRGIIFDSYEESLKTMAKGYEFGFPQIYTLKKKQEKVAGIWQRIGDAIKKYFSELFK